MNRQWLKLAAALGAGGLFGAGLTVSGMTKPSKVIGFLDPLGRWDASLMFVMVGAIAVHFLAYRLVKRRTSPWLAPSFALPTRRDLDLKLIAGSVLFGVGWGIGGFCPGPGLTSLGTGAPQVIAFVTTLIAGMFGAAKLETWLTQRAAVRRARREAPRQGAESAA